MSEIPLVCRSAILFGNLWCDVGLYLHTVANPSGDIIHNVFANVVVKAC